MVERSIVLHTITPLVLHTYLDTFYAIYIYIGQFLFRALL